MIASWITVPAQTAAAALIAAVTATDSAQGEAGAAHAQAERAAGLADLAADLTHDLLDNATLLELATRLECAGGVALHRIESAIRAGDAATEAWRVACDRLGLRSAAVVSALRAEVALREEQMLSVFDDEVRAALGDEHAAGDPLSPDDEAAILAALDLPGLPVSSPALARLAHWARRSGEEGR